MSPDDRPLAGPETLASTNLLRATRIGEYSIVRIQHTGVETYAPNPTMTVINFRQTCLQHLLYGEPLRLALLEIFNTNRSKHDYRLSIDSDFVRFCHRLVHALFVWSVPCHL